MLLIKVRSKTEFLM